MRKYIILISFRQPMSPTGDKAVVKAVVQGRALHQPTAHPASLTSPLLILHRFVEKVSFEHHH